MARTPIIPETITVHLGPPDQGNENVTLSFPDYIKNVSSSEIFPSWPENAIRANIYAQISFALNRVYTEYYRSRGYDFDITSDTSIDQSFVSGRDIFDNVSRIVDELFNDYLRRPGSVEPLFARYCNGTTTTCQGLSQWGTVNLANQGYSPYQILQYYYGEDLEIVTEAPVAGISASLPLAPLSIGSTGDDVLSLQLRLNRIANNYPAIPKIDSPKGFFDAPTEDAVIAFQEIFDLAPDGVVGKSTWYRIQYIYNSVKKLNELDSEGLSYGEIATQFPGSLSQGDSGLGVKDVQYLLAFLAQYEQTIPPITPDGVFGPSTAAAVRSFQSTYGLTVNGIVDESTYLTLYEAYIGILASLPPDLYQNGAIPYPGAPLVLGSESSAVLALQEYLNRLSEIYPSLGTLEENGVYDVRTEAAVAEFQRLQGLDMTGAVGAVTWNAIADLYNDLLSSDYLANGQYPGFELTGGENA